MLVGPVSVRLEPWKKVEVTEFSMPIWQSDIYSNHLRRSQNLDDSSNISNESLLHALSPRQARIHDRAIWEPCNPLLTVHMDDDNLLCDIWVGIMQAPS